MMIRRKAVCFSFLCFSLCAVVAAGQAPKDSARQPGQQALEPLSPQEIFKRISPSVMVVESLDVKGAATAFGSGVVIAPGRIVTNRHVIEGGVSFRVVHGGNNWPAKLIGVDPDHDLAELSAEGVNAPAVQVRASSALAVGEKVYSIGAPEGLELTISEGLISGLRDFDKDRLIQTSAAISHGSSGGGLFDAEGRLVGITTFYLKEGQSLNFALPGEWTLALDRQPASAPPGTGQNSTAFDALAWSMAGYKAEQAGKYDQAVSAYREAIRLKPDFPEAWYNLGAAYNGLGEYEQELSAEREAIRLKPDLEAAWNNLGNTYNTLGQYDKAASALQEAIRLKPDDPAARYNLGNAYYFLRQYDKAASAEREAVRLKPDLGEAWGSLGNAYSGLKQYDKAVSAFHEALRLKPDLAQGWYNLGWAYKQKGRRSEVTSVYERLKSLDPKLADEFFKKVVLP